MTADIAPGSRRTIVLASRSPRRSELLAAAGISFEVLAADIDETPHTNEAPEAYVERLAIEKASAVLALRAGLLQMDDLSTQLVGFVQKKR